MNRRSNVGWSLVGLTVAFAGAATAEGADEPGRPNVLFVVADDLGWADVGWHGGRFRTPHLDRLVREGVELDRHYVQPVCTPTRTALLSGRWTSRFGPHVLSPSNLRAFPPGTTTIASAFREAGYGTFLAGKWHLGSRPEWGPNQFGFDESYGSFAGAVDPWTHRYRRGVWERSWQRNGQYLDEDGNATELVSRQVVQWIESQRRATRPWFIYVPFHAVHIPVDTPDEYKRPYAESRFHEDPKKNESLRRFGAFVTQLDTKVGEFVAALERTDQRRNTLVVFTSDNGGLHAGQNAYVSQVPPTPALSSNLPLRGQKGQLFEGGIRVAAFANWPSKLTPRKVTAPLHAVDWMPTLTRLVGWNPAKFPEFDGLDIWPILTGEVTQPPPRTIYIPMPRSRALLYGGWKLIAPNADPPMLFHVAADPAEEHDLAGTEPARLAEMQERLTQIRRGDRTELPEDLRGVGEAF